MTYIAEPIQRTELRSLAKVMREILQVEDRLYIPVITILENVMPLLFPDFSYEYVPREEFPKKKHGETDIVNHIEICRSVCKCGIRTEEKLCRLGFKITELKLYPM